MTLRPLAEVELEPNEPDAVAPDDVADALDTDLSDEELDTDDTPDEEESDDAAVLPEPPPAES